MPRVRLAPGGREAASGSPAGSQERGTPKVICRVRRSSSSASVRHALAPHPVRAHGRARHGPHTGRQRDPTTLAACEAARRPRRTVCCASAGGEWRRSCCADGAHSSPETPGEDEVEASGGARSEALPLLHRCTGSSDGPTAPIQAVRGRRSRPMPPTAPTPSSRMARRRRDRTPQSARDREPGSRSATRSRRGCRARRAVPSSSSAAGTKSRRLARARRRNHRGVPCLPHTP